jgi:hypothetical protein
MRRGGVERIGCIVYVPLDPERIPCKFVVILPFLHPTLVKIVMESAGRGKKRYQLQRWKAA